MVLKKQYEKLKLASLQTPVPQKSTASSPTKQTAPIITASELRNKNEQISNLNKQVKELQQKLNDIEKVQGPNAAFRHWNSQKNLQQRVDKLSKQLKESVNYI